jgi:hypothetical protein
MDNCIQLQKYSDKLFAQKGIKIPSKDRYKVVKQVALYLDTLIFNTISLFCLIAIINNTTKITDQTIVAGMKFMNMQCPTNLNKSSQSMSGGRLGCATYLGITEPMYSSKNPTNDILSVDFNNGVARPQIGGATIITELDKIIVKYMNKVLTYHKVTVSKSTKHTLTALINNHINCFLSLVMYNKGSLTLNAVEKLIKKHKSQNKKLT